MCRLSCILTGVLLLAASQVHAAGLPDTGQDTCYNDSAADVVGAANAGSIAGDAGTHPRQDCRFGRDAAAAAGVLSKTGAGPKGTDYTKIANNGAPLAASAVLGTAATDWACTHDNITGLTWEVKANVNSGLRSTNYSYAWYNTDSRSNGGNQGHPSAFATCGGSLPNNQCNTQAYVTAVNAIALCTYTDWRVPAPGELLSLYAGEVSGVSFAYFPNSFGGSEWSAATYVRNPQEAWDVQLESGTSFHADKSQSVRPVRLVRGTLQ